eukprot:TRINITY_DN226_c0_g1_i2.p1 TRINITY_DN226_c0_g1~~TRINITY_DN226_c0_g1_i2.p1  ORF type:complete len:115 (+),score=15.37 TRINITY_DN226_c0_g1_i2:300-644(+)
MRVLYHRPVMVFPSSVYTWNGLSGPADLSVKSLSLLSLFTPQPSIVLFGTGTSTIFPPDDVIDFLEEKGISWESMGTFYAASTFNFLNQERRGVVACLFPVKTDQRFAKKQPTN